MPDKPKFAMYWAAGCGGCEIAVLNIAENILDLDANFDVVFWPIAMDAKTEDVEALPDGSIAVCFFNGGIRNDDNEAMAHLLRRKSQVLVSFGACASQGGIPGLANLYSTHALLDLVYQTPTTDNPAHLIPQPRTLIDNRAASPVVRAASPVDRAASPVDRAASPVDRAASPVDHAVSPEDEELLLPQLYHSLKTLDQVTTVDYTVPGCPPESHQIVAVLELVIKVMHCEATLPPKGSVLGAGTSTVCDECPRLRNQKSIRGFKRMATFQPNLTECLLEQGILCSGIATRSGCQARCPTANMPCIGCYGPAEGVVDQGARMLSAVSSVLEGKDEEQIRLQLDGIVDPAGTFYRFGLPSSLLHRARRAE